MLEARVRELIGECQRLYDDLGPIEAIHEHLRVLPIAHGWYMAVRRASEAVILLTDAGHDLEASPLRRYVIEHAVALRWLAEASDDAVTAILRGHQHWLRTLQSSAQAAGSDVAQDPAFDIMLGIDPGTSSDDHYLHFRQRCDNFGSPQLMYGYAIETNRSHPSFSTAEVFLDHQGDGEAPLLLHEPRPGFPDMLSTVLACLLHASESLNRLIVDQPWSADLHRIDAELRSDIELAAPTGDQPGPPTH